ncbi:MAG: sigma-54-dependent Fis family transcriptional regulator, partial [Bacteroidetes bacterium]
QGFTEEALEALVDYSWPGNVRQLKNTVERLVIMTDSPMVDLFTILDRLETQCRWSSNSIPRTLEELKAFKRRLLEENYARIEKLFLLKALEEHGGNISKAAQAVGMKRPNFSTLMKRHGIASPRK